MRENHIRVYKIEIASGEADCIDPVFSLAHQIAGAVQECQVDLLAATRPEVDQTTEHNIPLWPTSTSEFGDRDFAWIELIDLTRQRHREGPSISIADVDTAHKYRACAVAPHSVIIELQAEYVMKPDQCLL